ncbi:hypothetical protein EJ02DRAFT_507172 [Clathrospora elynae]|uniref:GH16 domain-containing protein n=1 Tax=Clathrospora elynae TaxID=706981 RepID=A0A6A5S6V6_9PLEO|nr:hypothetical protein EJ02DRAFT_507172 [Clathrospora elynae]
MADMRFLVFWLLLRFSVATTDVASCSCGFLDPRTGAIWTDAIVTYGNETEKLPVDSLVAEEYQHPYEKNWNARYRSGALPTNIGHNDSTAPGWNGSAWTLSLERPTKNHFVVGASIRSLRRDIRYGTFESALGPPKPGVGGSVLAMRLDYNESQTLSVNVMNADDPKDAWTSFMIYGDWRGARDKGVNFTDFGNSTYNYPNSPWGIVPYRFEWTDKNANFFIGDALARSIRSRDTPKGWPTTASTLYIRHSSIGDQYTSEGPPPNGSYTHVGLLRAFFNSSLMSEIDHASFDARCDTKQQCLVTDTSLLMFKERPIDYKKRWPAIFVASICIAISTVLLLHALIKRAPWKTKLPASANGSSNKDVTLCSAQSSWQDLSATPSVFYSEGYGLTDAAQTPGFWTPGVVTPGTMTPGRTGTPRTSIHPLVSSNITPAWSEADTLMGGGGYFTGPVSSSTSLTVTPGQTRPGSDSLKVPPPVGISIHCRNRNDQHDAITPINESKQAGRSVQSVDEKKLPMVATAEIDEDKQLPDVTILEISVSTPTGTAAKSPISAPKQRVDYLAGLVALASIFVTLIHFCLTFLPATEIPYTHTHYKSELWALKIVTPYLLTFSWIGPFFTSSTRFLVMTYLKSGNLKGVAEKTVGRTPRLIIPCAAIAALEYFCMQVGAISWLEYLPSVTWSTWPYTSNYVTFGHFISEIIELMYIIPNAVPQITFNYCIGVLWTIPVQLQNSWTSLLAVIIIREIKTPWKRMCYYAFCIGMHWYAMSWGSFFWVGLLIADLDISYKWKTWLYARPWVYYPLLAFVAILALGSPSIDLVGQWTTMNFNTLEYGVHPHQRTGHLIRDSVDYGYPPYYIPRLSALTFSIGFHLLVELSPVVQKFFSNRLLMWLFPHILTLYLIHGLIFWSLGAVICVKLAAHGVPYWANMLVVAVCTYTVIFGCLPFLTPVIETLGKSITMNIWRDASERPAPRRKTLYPFDPDMFKDGTKNDTEVVPKSDDVEKNEIKVASKAL